MAVKVEVIESYILKHKDDPRCLRTKLYVCILFVAHTVIEVTHERKKSKSLGNASFKMMNVVLHPDISF